MEGKKIHLCLNRSLERDEIGGLVILLGINNSGKSNIISAIRKSISREFRDSEDQTTRNKIAPQVIMKAVEYTGPDKYKDINLNHEDFSNMFNYSLSYRIISYPYLVSSKDLTHKLDVGGSTYLSDALNDPSKTSIESLFGEDLKTYSLENKRPDSAAIFAQRMANIYNSLSLETRENFEKLIHYIQNTHFWEITVSKNIKPEK